MAKVETKRGLSEERLREFLREMLLIRRFEEKVEERFRAGELPGFLHVAIGQEAVAVGVCQAMDDGDVFASTHRAHGHTLARGTHPNAVMAELYGKLEGCSHGYGGSMHLYDVERGNLGANAVVGGGLPAITGAALAFKLRGEPRVAVAFFGDGATNIGTFHESLNLAQLWQVPAVFVLEDNHWAESTPESQHSPIRDLSERAEAFGMKSMKVDGQDVEEVHKVASRALKHARDGKGPVFLHVSTERLVGHYIGDPQVYRDKDELHELQETRDPITLLREKLGVSDEEFEATTARCTRSSRPRSSSRRPAPTRSPRTPSRTSMPELSYREAVRDALSQAMRDDDDVFVMGEDIAEMGGSMGVTQGCSTSSGPSGSATRRSRRWRSSAPGSARRCRACARSSRSCTRTS